MQLYDLALNSKLFKLTANYSIYCCCDDQAIWRILYGSFFLVRKKENSTVVVQLLSHVQLFATLWTATHQASLSFTTSQSLLKHMPTYSVMLSNHFILCHPLLLPSVFPSIKAFSNESVLCIRWPKYWSFSFRISPSNEYSVLISFRMDWLDLLAVRGTLKSLLQHHSFKVFILGHLAFFMVQLWENHSFDYMDLCQQSNGPAFYSESGESVLKILALFSDSRVQQDPM